MEKRKFHEEFLSDKQAACGRTVEEQIESVKADGTHAVSSVLRQQLLYSLGIRPAKEAAENVVIFGCYKPFTSPDVIRAYLKLLDIFNIDYTWLEKEYCCGFPIIGQHPEKKAQCEQFNQSNIALAEGKNAKKVAYCCIGCATAARHLAYDSTTPLAYILDIILDEMEKLQNKIKPMTIGYFEGCHTWFHYNFPNGKQNWPRYRNVLDKIEGLTVIDLPSNLCCKRSTNKILCSATDLNVDKIVAPCIDCHKKLYDEAGDRMEVISYPELLLRVLETR